MEILWLLCKGTGMIALAAFFITLVYAIVSTLVQRIIEDIKGGNQYKILRQNYEELLKKVERLEIEAIDKELDK